MQTRRFSFGQAIVEYAILLVFVTLLIVGGVELGIATFNGSRTASAAEGGVDAWIYASDKGGIYQSPYGQTIPSDIFRNVGADASGLGDHDPGRFQRPTCLPVGYDDGLPADSVTRDPDLTAVYLFNPLPIDITNCAGQDADVPSKTRQSVLLERLPRLNRALISIYGLHCANAAGDEISCTDQDQIVTQYLRLPGKLDPDTDTVRLGFLDTDPNSPTFQSPLATSPRPVIAVACAAYGQVPAQTDVTAVFDPSCDTPDAPLNICWSRPPDVVPLACEVQVWVRFRHVFYSFLQAPFVLWRTPLPADALDQLDLGPGGTYGGVLGGEVGTGGVRLFQRTFQWCYQTRSRGVGDRVARPCGDTNPI